LWREYLRVVRAVDPQVFVIENVDRFSRSAEFDLLMHELAAGSLRRWSDVAWGVLDAADYGVPQRRRRTILIASRVGPVGLPEPTHGRPGSGRPRWRTVRDALRRVPYLPEAVELPESSDEPLGVRIPGLFKSPELHVTRRPTDRSIERYAHIPPGGGRFDLPDRLKPPCWLNKPTGTSDVMGRLVWDEPSVTIRTEFFKPEKGRYLHPQWERADTERMVNRPITHFEAALLQSFPRSFRWAGKKSEIARQIGNAVPPKLAKAIAVQVGQHLR
jgi:DNA (cytosine-5)-methyltransferase 1